MSGMISGGPQGLAASGVTRFVRTAAISVAIPAIVANSSGTVAVPVPGILAGDTIKTALTSDSAAMPANVIEAMPHTVAAGSVTLRFGNLSTLATSTATTVKMIITYWGP